MRRTLLLFLLVISFAGCKRDDMADQARGKPLGESSFFADGAVSRLPPAHTVAVNAPLDPATDSLSWYEPTQATRFPFEITRDDLVRGQKQFTIYCTPCHGEL